MLCPCPKSYHCPYYDILFTNTTQSIDQMMLAPTIENIISFSLEALTQLYQNLDFTTRAKIFEILFPKNDQLPENNPPYPSSIFPHQAF